MFDMILYVKFIHNPKNDNYDNPNSAPNCDFTPLLSHYTIFMGTMFEFQPCHYYENNSKYILPNTASQNPKKSNSKKITHLNIMFNQSIVVQKKFVMIVTLKYICAKNMYIITYF